MKLVFILLVLQLILLTNGAFEDEFEEYSLYDSDRDLTEEGEESSNIEEMFKDSSRRISSLYCPPCYAARQKNHCCCVRIIGKYKRCDKMHTPIKMKDGFCCNYYDSK